MIDLTPSQRKTVAAGITAMAAAALVAVALVVGWAVMRFLALASPALTPVIMGLFLATFFKPYYGWFVAKLRNPALALFAMAVSVALPLGAVCWIGGAFVVDQASHLAAAAPTIVAKFSAWANATFPSLLPFLRDTVGLSDAQLLFFTNPTAFMHDTCAQLSAAYGGKAVKAGVDVLKWLSGLGSWLITLIFAVFFLTRPTVKGEDCVRQMPFLKPETQGFVARQIDLFTDIVVSFFQRQVVICLIEGCLYGLGFLIVGLPYGFVIGFLLGVLNLVPLFGTVVCLPLALPIAYFGDGGSLMRLVGVVCVWAAGQVLDGYLITPKIQGKKTGLGYAGVIFSFFFWGVVFQSLFGLLVAIPLSAFCVVFWRAFRDRYVKGVI